MTTQCDLYFTPRQNCSLEHHLDVSGKHQPHCNYYAKAIRSHIPLSLATSIARFSFIKLSTLKQLGVNEFTIFCNRNKRIRTRFIRPIENLMLHVTINKTGNPVKLYFVLIFCASTKSYAFRKWEHNELLLSL